MTTGGDWWFGGHGQDRVPWLKGNGPLTSGPQLVYTFPNQFETQSLLEGEPPSGQSRCWWS
jgi:hypothetical protein